MSNHHNHDHASLIHHNKRLLKYALAITTLFMLAEIIGSIYTGSLALLSDAAHMFTDAAAMAIALAAIQLGQRPADSKRTYGYWRFEILAAAFNAVILFLAAIYIIIEAYHRFKQPPEIQSIGVLIIAITGLLVNLISMHLLKEGKDTNLNLKGAYLEAWSDMLGSVGVILAAILVNWFNWLWADSVVAVLIGLWVLPRAWILLTESFNILLEGVPKGINPVHILRAMNEIAGAGNIHDLHVWAISSHRIMLTAHIFIEPGVNAEQMRVNLQQLLEQQFHIQHATLQMEYSLCKQASHCIPLLDKTN